MNNVFMENQICRKNEILYYNIHLKKFFDVIYQFTLRKHSAKVVSSGFIFFQRFNRVINSKYGETSQSRRKKFVVGKIDLQKVHTQAVRAHSTISPWQHGNSQGRGSQARSLRCAVVNE